MVRQVPSMSRAQTQKNSAILPRAGSKGETDGESTSNATVLVNQLLKGRYSARYYLPDKIDKATIEDIVDAAKNSPSGYNTQYAPGLFVFSPASQLTPISGPWKVYCIAGSVKEAISAEMLEADKNHAPYAPQYTYYPPTLPPDYAARRFDFGKVFYGALGIERDDLAGRDTENARNYEFFDAPVALIITISSELRRGSWMDLGLFMQSITIGARARGLESVTQLSVATFDEIIRRHLPIPENELVAVSMSMGYPDLERVAKYYARPAKRELKDVLEIHGM